MVKLNQRGSFMIWFTLSFALLGTFVGFALDFGRLSRDRQETKTLRPELDATR